MLGQTGHMRITAFYVPAAFLKQKMKTIPGPFSLCPYCICKKRLRLRIRRYRTVDELDRKWAHRDLEETKTQIRTSLNI